jgi:PIN domain nuclease of toxin-antitoxin system
MLLLDTHALIWLTHDDRRLGRRVKSRIRGSLPGAIAVSTLSWWEIGCLAERGRLRLDQRLDRLRRAVLELERVRFRLNRGGIPSGLRM